MTPSDAQALQDAAAAHGGWLLWIVTDADLEYPGKFVARAHTADHKGGTYLPGALVVGTLAELREQIPNGLARRDRTSVEPPEVIETWD